MRLFFAQCSFALLAASIAAQQPQSPAPANTSTAPAADIAPATTPNAGPPHQPSPDDRRKAAKLFVRGAKLYVANQFEPALKLYQQAAKLDPDNRDYPLAVELAREHAAVALVQAAAKERNLGDRGEARTSLAHALELDPKNASASYHLNQLADDLVPAAAASEGPTFTLAPPIEPAPASGTHSFHLHISAPQLVKQVYQAWGIKAETDSSLRSDPVRFDIDDATFPEAIKALSLVTNSFAVTLEPRHVLVVRDTPQLRTQYQSNAMETISLLGLTQNEMHDVQAATKNVFDVQKMYLDESRASLTLEAPAATLKAINATWDDLSGGRPEILLDVRVLALANSSTRSIGPQLPQQMGVFNVYGEAESIISSNQSLVQQIISSGLAAPNDIATILAILIASGQVNSSLFSNGFAIFGGNCSLSSGTCSPTAFGLSPGSAGFTFSLNTSNSREIDDYQLRLSDGEEGTLKSGMKYPIMTSSYSSQLSGTSASAIAGLTGAGTSGALSSLAASLSSVPSVPMVQYQDLGLTLKATPRVMRSGDVALSIDMKIDSLQGTSLNSIPILASRVYTGVATMRANETVVLAGEADSSEIRSISGEPALSEIPGLNNATSTKQTQKSTSTLLIVITPRVVRNPHGLGHSPLRILDRAAMATRP